MVFYAKDNRTQIEISNAVVFEGPSENYSNSFAYTGSFHVVGENSNWYYVTWTEGTGAFTHPCYGFISKNYTVDRPTVEGYFYRKFSDDVEGCSAYLHLTGTFDYCEVEVVAYHEPGGTTYSKYRTMQEHGDNYIESGSGLWYKCFYVTPYYDNGMWGECIMIWETDEYDVYIQTTPDWALSYGNILVNYAASEEYLEGASKYSIYDIDQNGVPELIVSMGEAYTSPVMVFCMKDGKAERTLAYTGCDGMIEVFANHPGVIYLHGGIYGEFAYIYGVLQNAVFTKIHQFVDNRLNPNGEKIFCWYNDAYITQQEYDQVFNDVKMQYADGTPIVLGRSYDFGSWSSGYEVYSDYMYGD